MFRFTDAERESLSWFSALSTDGDGNEVLVGLTLRETEELMLHRRQIAAALEGTPRDHANKRYYNALNEKHGVARLGVLGAQIQIERENPPKH